MAAIDQIGKTVPNVILDNVILNRHTIDLRMHINEYLYAADAGTWFTDEAYKEKLQIRIRVETDRGFHDLYVPATQASEIDSTKLEQVQKIYYSFSFSVTDSQALQDLFDPGEIVTGQNNTPFICDSMSITVESFISRQKLSPPINFGPINFVQLAGEKSTVNVISDGEALTRTTGYFLGNSFYTGPKTQLANGRWVTGNVVDESSEFLIERNVPNIKVMDNRDVFQSTRDADSLLLESSQMQANEPAPPYFSELSATRDTNGVLRFLFTFDYRRAYSKNSLYGNIFDNLSDRLQDRVLLMSTLQTLELKRTRFGSAFSESITETVVVSGETSGDRFVDINSDRAALKEEEFNFQKGTLHLRTFSGADKIFEEISTGEYKYDVTATVRDGIYRFLTFQLDDINRTTAELKNYIDSIQSADTYSNGLLKESFIEKVKAENSFLNRPYIRALVSLSENIHFYRTVDTKKLINSIRSWLSPVTSTRDSLNAAYSLMTSIQARMNQLKNIVMQDASEDTTSGETRGGLIFSVDETFNQTFDATDTFKKGMTFLSSTEILESTDPDGLLKITSSDFEKRIESECINFFKSKEATFSISGVQDTLSSTSRTTSFTYLTPTAVRINNQIYAVGTVKNLKSTEGINVDALSLGDTKNKYKLVLSQLRTSKIADSGLGTEVLDITPVSDPDFETISSNGDGVSSPAAASTQNFGYSMDSKGYDNPFEKLQLNEVMSSESDDTILLTGITGQQAQFTRKQFDLLPNYFKAILAGSQNFGDSYSNIFTKATNGDIDPYSLIIGSAVKLEVLIDYKKNSADRPQYLVRQGSWVPLTYELYRAQAGSNLLCRMSKYNNDAIGFKRSNDAAIYNHLFVLESPIVSNIYGPDSNGLQTDINGARSLSDLIEIFSNYGIEYDPNADEDLDVSIGADGCAALVDEQSVEEMSDDNV